MLAIRIALTIYVFMVIYSLFATGYYNGPSHMPKVGGRVVIATWMIFVSFWCLTLVGLILSAIWGVLP